MKLFLGGSEMVNLDLKIAIIRNFGSQIVASRRLKIQENKLSHLVQGHNEPNERERELLRKALGADYFSKQEDGPQAA
jgi:hypothetical protein